VVIRTREIYHSANGDRWLLALDFDTDRVFVRHEPNLPSAGQVADIDIGASQPWHRCAASDYPVTVMGGRSVGGHSSLAASVVRKA
jgi:hypothetical protein